MKKSKNIFWGVLLIAAAVLIVLSNLNVIDIFSGFSAGNIILLVILFAILVKGIMSMNFFSIFIPIGLMIFVMRKMSFMPEPVSQLGLWTVLLVSALLALGFSLLFKKHRHVQININNGNKEVVINQNSDNQQDINDGVVSIDNNMGATTKYVDCNNFRELHTDNNFGSLNAYLSNVTLSSAQCKIVIDNNFGTTNLYIPKEWQVVLNPDSSFGRIDFRKTYEAPEGSPIAYINAETSFGSVSIFQI